MPDEIMKKINDQEVKYIQVFMMKELINFLESKNISYYVIAGTLLGSVRHEGFIPWDDDVDIAMKREDYNNFLSVFNEFDTETFYLQNWFTEEEYGLPFSKLKINESIYEEEVIKELNIHKGIFIDIFPYDEVGKSKIQFLIQKHISTILKKVILIKSGYKSDESKIIKKITEFMIRKLLFIFKKSFLIDCFENLSSYFGSKSNKSDYYVCTGGSYGFEKEIVSKKWFDKSVLLKFETIEVSGPSMYKEYLKNLYGDYLTLPPVENRVSRHKIEKKEISYDMLNSIKQKS